MKRRWKYIIATMSGVGLLIGYFSYEIVSARMNDAQVERLAARVEAGEEIPPEELRNVAQSLLSKRFSREHHDAAALLVDYGREESIPYLIKALKWNPPGSTLCTTTHILEALRAITGEDLGDTAADWKTWKPSD